MKRVTKLAAAMLLVGSAAVFLPLVEAATDVRAMPDRQVRPGAVLHVWGNAGNGGQIGVGTADGEAYTWSFSGANFTVTPVSPPLGGVVTSDRYIVEYVTFTLTGGATRTLVVGTLDVGGTRDTVTIDLVDPSDPISDTPQESLTVDVNIAIEDALLFAYLQQNANGSWSNTGGFGTTGNIANTGLCAQAFENSGHAPTGTSAYSPFVQKGLDFIFGTSQIVNISGHAGANFHNHLVGPLGIDPVGGLGTFREGYAGAMAIAAVEASLCPTCTVSTGPAANLTYKQYVEEWTDVAAYAQRDNAGQNNGQGGWEYQYPSFASGGDDMSIDGWTYFALIGADTAFTSAYNPKIKDNVDTSLVNRQDSNAGSLFGRFGYRSTIPLDGGPGYATTCAGLGGLALEELPGSKSAGTPDYPASGNPPAPANLDSFQEKRDAALAMLGRNWGRNPTGVAFGHGNHGNHYNMTHCCRGLREIQGTNQADHILHNDGTFGGTFGDFNWETNIAPPGDSITRGYWPFLVSTQQPDGRWQTGFFAPYDANFDTCTALLCLQPTLFGPPNQPPTCDANGPYSAECAGATTSVLLDGAGSSDPDNDPLTYSWTTDCPGGTFSDPTSSTPTLTLDTSGVCNLTCNVALTVSDGNGGISSCSSTVTILDTTPPAITCPPSKTFVVPATPAGAIITYTGATATDTCDPNPTVDCVPPSGSLFPLGDTVVTCTATDACGNASSCSFVVTVVGCPICDGSTVVVDQNVTTDFNTPVPTCSGDPDLCALFSYDTSGPTADTWKAIFDLGPKKLLVKNGVTITTGTVPATSNNRRAPGLEIHSTCAAEIEAGGTILVRSVNKPAGDILIQVDGNVVVDGTVLNEVTGTNGTPGDITIETSCGDIDTGRFSRIKTVGQDFGGSDITLTACARGENPDPSAGPAEGDMWGIAPAETVPFVVGRSPASLAVASPLGGNIAINGLVDASYKAAPPSTINVNASLGTVTIDGRNLIEIEAGTQRRVTSGVTVRSRRDPVAGDINIQGGTDVTILGNRILTTNPATQNYGAVAIKSGGTNGTSGDGAMKVVCLDGGISGSDRAFDFANRFNASNDITLHASDDIDLSVTGSINAGAGNNVKAVVSTQGGDTGKGGTNTLRSFSGGISIGAGAQVLANFTGRPGSNGTNLLTSCTGVTNAGTVNPADLVPGDDTGVCVPPAPEPILPVCDEGDVLASCLPTSSLSVLAQGPNVTTYVPNGSWGELVTGVKVAPVEGVGPFTTIATPNPVNSCASNWVTGATVCTANNTDVYVITGSTLNSTLTSGASGFMDFSGGQCANCGVAIDAGANQAVIAVALGFNTGGFQFLDLGTSTFGTPVAAGMVISENILVDPFRHFVLSPNEQGVYQILRTQPTTELFNNDVAPGHALDSAAEDCATGIALSSDEFTGNIFIADLTQATFTPGSPGSWTAPSQLQNFPELDFPSAGTTGIAVAPGSRLAVLADEFGTDAFGCIQLPATSGTGTPAIVDWAAASMPNDPNGQAWLMGLDPHTVTAYVSPNNGRAYGLIMNRARTFVARVDLVLCVGCPKVSTTDHHCTSLPAGTVTFIPLPP